MRRLLLTPFALLAFCVLFWMYDPDNRYLKRLLSLGFIAIALTSAACEFTGTPNPRFRARCPPSARKNPLPSKGRGMDFATSAADV